MRYLVICWLPDLLHCLMCLFSVCMYLCIYVHMCTCMYIYMHACMYGTGHMQCRTREQILSKHTHHQVQVLGGNCIVYASGRVSTHISCYHTSCC